MTTYTLATLDEWAQKSEERMEATIKTALQDLHEDIQRPRAKGGRMPVDTGFLRNSAGAALNSAPETERPDAVGVVINRLQVGDVFQFGWGAKYAPYMNNKYAFLDLPVQDWQGYVFRAIQKVKP